MPTPIHALRFNQLLQGYEPNWRKYLVRGLTQGFPLEINFGAQFQSKDTPPLRYNHQSLYRHIQPIREKINKELDAGRVEGPYDVIPYDNYHISPLAAQEKKTPGEYRILHDLSWPKGASVNDEIPKNAGKCTYQSMDAIIDSLVELGPNTNLTVIDIEHAYKVLPVHPFDVPKMGFYFDGHFYFDKTLAMGCRTSAKIFERFSSALEWIMKHKCSLKHLHHVLDDFLLLTKPAALSEAQIKIFLDMCKYLGIPIKMAKLKSGLIVIYLGFEIDSIKMEVRLPLDKLEKCITKINAILAKPSVQMLQLQSLVGLLEFACKVVRPGRAFLRRAHNAIKAAKSQHHYIKVDSSLKADLNMWLTFLRSFNGKVVFPEKLWNTSETLCCYTDSSLKGYGLVFGSHWIHGEFPEAWSKQNILALEAYPVMLLFDIFGPQLSNKRIIMHIDNSALVNIVNKQTPTHSTTMIFVRHFVLKAMQFNILFKAEWVSTKDNNLADPLSRSQIDVFKTTAEEKGLVFDAEPTKVPTNLLPSNFQIDLTSS